MNIADRPFFAHSDELLLSAHMLAALEVGKISMHARDYEVIASRTVDIVDMLSSTVVVRLRQEGPESLRVVAENVLHDRGEVNWAPDRAALDAAKATWSGLCERLGAAIRR